MFNKSLILSENSGARYTLILSTSSRLSSSCRRSKSWMVRVLAWFAIRAAFSSVPPFFRYAVIPVARKL